MSLFFLPRLPTFVLLSFLYTRHQNNYHHHQQEQQQQLHKGLQGIVLKFLFLFFVFLLWLRYVNLLQIKRVYFSSFNAFCSGYPLLAYSVHIKKSTCGHEQTLLSPFQALGVPSSEFHILFDSWILLVH